ncbi:hypothetical protein [Nonomuraea diastatica]|uniref:hypothetical protein n=1 Tax=Nonomuraea diastatica TaxID=1848329 RepID=UPI001C701E4E|nr:hypothetical protein [Nonomuraea diastatica]
MSAEAVQGLDRAELAARIAKGAFACVAILDPGLIVLGGELGQQGGDALAEQAAEHLRAMSPAPTEIRATTVKGDAVLHGAVLTALDRARDNVFSAVTPER